jgi:hypothetical protein
MVANGFAVHRRSLVFSMNLSSNNLAGDLRISSKEPEATMRPTLRMNKHVSVVCRFSIGVLAVTGVALAQDQAPHAWRSVSSQAPADLSAQVQAAPDQGAPGVSAQNQATQDQATQNQGFPAGQQGNPGAPPDAQQGPPPPNYGPNYGPNNAPPPPPPVPAQLTINQGTYVIVRINQWLSSDRNHQGDTFTATVEQPVVVDGVVVAPRGATVLGTVTEAQKAGRVEGTSRLAVQLTELTLVDGQQVSIQSQMINRNGPTSVGRDTAAVGGTTALGAIVGAAAAGGQGAAIGAGAGAAAGIIGVLLTRGRPTLIYPESVMTFQIQAPVTFSTEHSPQAFQYVNTQPSYGPQPYLSQRPPASPYGAGPGAGPYGGAPPPPAYPYAYGYPAPYPYAYGYPYPYYGGFGVFIGPRFGYGGYYRGFRR